MYKSDILYIKDKKGNPQQWRVWTEGDSFIVEWGKVGGKMQTKTTKCKAKNVGKANATTPEEQAILEAKAKFEHQILREDYNTNIDKAGTQIRAMLALDYTKVGHRVNWSGVLVQPKLDGLRLTSGSRYRDEESFEMLTRKGETYSLPHLEEGCKYLLNLLENWGYTVYALDGEVYLHGLSLQTISSWARAFKEDKTPQLEYHLFDLVMEGVSFKERYAILKMALQTATMYNPELMVKFKLVQTEVCENPVELKNWHATWNQYEGVMIRHEDSLYECGERSAGLFKYKEFLTEEFKITGVWEDNNQNAMLTCITKEGKSFHCTPKRTFEERKKMLENKELYIGKWETVKFQAYTDDNIPEFPVGLCERECNEKGEPLV